MYTIEIFFYIICLIVEKSKWKINKIVRKLVKPKNQLRELEHFIFLPSFQFFLLGFDFHNNKIDI